MNMTDSRYRQESDYWPAAGPFTIRKKQLSQVENLVELANLVAD